MQITCSDLAVGYNAVALQSDINFTIASGAYVCIVGENGVGKSTFMKTLLGLLPPIRGQVLWGNGTQPLDIGYLPQQTQAQKDFPASVYEVVLSGCISKMGLRPFYSKNEKKYARETLEKLHISHLSKRSYNELSGGQQQRVLLARALCATSTALLLDEPTAGLDSATTQDFYKLIQTLHGDGITVLMITHHVQEALADADYVLCLSRDGVQYMTKEAYLYKTSGQEICKCEGTPC